MDSVYLERQRHWSRCFAVAIDTLPVSVAVGVADEALKEYDKRFPIIEDEWDEEDERGVDPFDLGKL